MRKFLLHILILLIILTGVGFLGTDTPVEASTENPNEECNTSDPANATNKPCKPQMGTCIVTDGVAPQKFGPETEETCKKRGDISSGISAKWTKGDADAINPVTGNPVEGTVYKSEFERQIKLGCIDLIKDFDGCVLQFFYWTWHDIPALVLAQTAYFFNVMLSVSMDGKLFQHDFVYKGWAIVRDLSNIFFILVLLYIAIRWILGLAGHGIKEMIGKVVIFALLINFSMFFTGVVIDASNMLALVFYNKLKVETTVDGEPRPYASVRGEKDVSGGLVAAFDPTRALNEEFFTEMRKTYVDGQLVESLDTGLPFGTTLAMIFIAGLIMLFAVYALFISAFAFLARLVELWMLIIASPFAFMSSILHELEGLKDWGWKNWLHRLITTSFMAPAFMFFLYFIFLLIQSKIFSEMIKPLQPGENDAAGVMKLLLGIVLPMMLILTLLLKAVKLAKAGAGNFGEAIIGIGQQIRSVVGGLAVGAATGGAAIVGRATVGRLGTHYAESGLAKKWEARGWGGEYARRLGTAMGSASFDVRGAKIGGKTLAGVTGLKVGEAKKGGFIEMRKEQVAKRQKRAKDLEVGENEDLKQNLNGLEEAKQSLLREVSHDIEILDSRIKVWRDRVKDRNDRVRALKQAEVTGPELDEAIEAAKVAADNLKDINDHRKAIKDGDTTYKIKTKAAALDGQDVGKGARALKTKIIDHDGKEQEVSINDLEDDYIPHAEHELHKENNRRKWIHADTTTSGLHQTWEVISNFGDYSFRGAREAAHKTRMNAKIEGGGKKGGHGDDHSGGGHKAEHKEHKAESKGDKGDSGAAAAGKH